MAENRRPAPAEVVLLVAAFLVVHAALGRVDVAGLGWVDVAGQAAQQPAGDVTGAYRFWIEYWQQTGVLVGVGTEWVYPIAALPPMLLSAVFGGDAYLLTWLAIVTVLDAVALVLLIRRDVRLAWWWLAFTALLGPVALVRIDAVALPIAIVGVLAVAGRPAVASALFTLAAWVKVWPAALVAAMLLAGRRAVPVLGAAVGTTAVVIGLALLAGARATIFSFVTAQADRGLQVEAPIALPWLWSAALGLDGTEVYYDLDILTFQIRGEGVAAVGALMTPVLLIGVLGVVACAVAARVRRADPAVLLALTALGLVTATIALNKVGSPQYLTWFVAPVLLGLLADPRRFRVAAVLVLLLAGLTQLIYPWFYGGVTGTVPWVIAVLTVRNLLELVLLAWSVTALLALRGPVRRPSSRTPAVQWIE